MCCDAWQVRKCMALGSGTLVLQAGAVQVPCMCSAAVHMLLLCWCVLELAWDAVLYA
jgi:hypothetical protein